MGPEAPWLTHAHPVGEGFIPSREHGANGHPRAGVNPAPTDGTGVALRNVGEGFIPSRKREPTNIRGRG